MMTLNHLLEKEQFQSQNTNVKIPTVTKNQIKLDSTSTKSERGLAQPQSNLTKSNLACDPNAVPAFF